MRASREPTRMHQRAGHCRARRLSTAKGVPHTHRVPPESEDAGFLIHQLPSIFG